MKNIVLFLLSGISLTLALSSCERKQNGSSMNTFDDALPPADSIALTYLPGIVSTNSTEFGTAISPDGSSFYFARSENGQSDIYVIHFDCTKSPTPIKLSFNSKQYSEADPALSPDGKLYFISNRPKDSADQSKDYDIWFVTLSEKNEWSAPQNAVMLNSDSSEFYISFSQRGNIYFASSRTGGFGQEDIYKSNVVDEHYGAPQNVGPVINTSNSEYDPFITSEEDILVFASSGRKDSFGKADLYGSLLNANQWEAPVNFGAVVNTKEREYCPYFPPYSNYFFFSSGGEIKWINKRMFVK